MAESAGPREPAEGGAEARRFSTWLKAMADHAGVAEASALHAFLNNHGCQCTRDGAAQWLAGEDPSYEKSRDIIKAFHDAFPELEVWDQYRRFVAGQPYLEDASDRDSHANQTLEQILEKSGLPPGLSD